VAAVAGTSQQPRAASGSLAARGLLPLRDLVLELAVLVERRAGLELLELEHPAQLDLGLGAGLWIGLERDPLGPLDRLLARLDLDDPVAGDQLLGLGERAVDHLALAAGREPDPRALRARRQAGAVEHHA